MAPVGALGEADRRVKSEWTPLATDFFRHPRVVDCDGPAKLLFIASLCYCQHYVTDGEFPSRVVPMLCAEADADHGSVGQLVAAGLWSEQESAYVIPGWSEWNRPAEQVKRRRQQDRDRKASARMSGGSSGGQSAGRPADVHASSSTSSSTTDKSSSSTTSPGEPTPVDDDDERIHQALLVVAERKAKDRAATNPNGYKRSVLKNFATDGTEAEARGWLERYPDLSATQLADVVLGNRNVLATATRAAS